MTNPNPQKAFEFLQQVKNDLKTKNRFSCDKNMDELIRRIASDRFYHGKIEEGNLLYRARVYTEENAITRYMNPPKEDFKGYGKVDSFVNLDHAHVSDGRCNPMYISYLYTATTECCSVYEVKPTRDSYVSVAQIRALTDLTILRFDMLSGTGSSLNPIIPDVSDSMLSCYLSMEFSRPYKNYGDYLLCQYVSEKVKAYGFDGLSYASSVYSQKDGEDRFCELIDRSNANVTVFNYNKCDAINSKLVFITDISIDYE